MALKAVYLVHEDDTMTVVEGESINRWERASIASAQLMMARHPDGKTGFEEVVFKPLTKKVTLKPKVFK